MRKPRGILGSMAANAKRRATNSATSAVYIALWGEKPKRKGVYTGENKRRKK